MAEGKPKGMFGAASDDAGMPAYDAGVACSLNANDFRERVATIRALARQSLRSAHRECGKLHLVYERSAEPNVRELVSLERRCCSFLDFAVEDAAEHILLTIIGSEAAVEAAHEIFAADSSRNSPAPQM